ncbi:hypothetical protein EDB80DRAFT_678381 [Ilyonectria destructans]|nr:hypothetical protein EDB80DRAFT_678381 [Ilyonectria destructans]
MRHARGLAALWFSWGWCESRLGPCRAPMAPVGTEGLRRSALRCMAPNGFDNLHLSFAASSTSPPSSTSSTSSAAAASQSRRQGGSTPHQLSQAARSGCRTKVQRRSRIDTSVRGVRGHFFVDTYLAISSDVGMRCGVVTPASGPPSDPPASIPRWPAALPTTRRRFPASSLRQTHSHIPIYPDDAGAGIRPRRRSRRVSHMRVGGKQRRPCALGRLSTSAS